MKLPDIQFSQVSAVQLESPAIAVAESRQKLALVNQAQAGADDIVDRSRKYTFAKTTAGYADRMSDFRKATIEETNVDRAKIIAWGLEDEIDTTGRDKFARSEWYPKLLSRVMDETQEEYASKITSVSDRNLFNAEVSRSNNAIMEREIEIAHAESLKEMQAMLVADIDEAATMGNYATAHTLIEASDMKPSEKKIARTELKAREDADEVRDEIQRLTDAGQPAALSQYADLLRSDEYNQGSMLDDKALDAAASQADAIAKGLIDDAEITSSKVNSNIASSELASIFDIINSGGDLTIDIISGAQNRAAERGDMQYVKTLQSIYTNYKNSGGISAYPDETPPDIKLGMANKIASGNIGASKSYFEANQASFAQSDLASFNNQINSMGTDQHITDVKKPQLKLTDRMALYGIDEDTYPADLAFMQSDLNRQIQEAVSRGKPLVSADIDNIIDGYVKEYSSQKTFTVEDGGFGYFDATESARDYLNAIIEQDPDGYYQVVADMESRGLAVTPSSFERAYAAWKKTKAK